MSAAPCIVRWQIPCSRPFWQAAVATAFALLLTLTLMSGASAQTGDIVNGKFLYNNWCAGCHGADPRQSQPHLAANRPEVLADAIDLVSQMNFLENVLAAGDVLDIAAYIGSVANTGVPVLNPTPTALEFGAQTVGIATAPLTLLLTNLGSVPLNIVSVTTTLPDFSVDGGCLGHRNPSSTCALSVAMNASSAGSIAAYAVVTFAESSTPMRVPLLGFGELPASTPLPIVIEFYNPDLDHYFITANAGEQTFVDSGAVGRWRRTGNAFRSGGAMQVCRFYGNAAANPLTGAPWGPNSHFYTASQSECDGLKALFDANAPSWKFESLDFSTVPLAGPGCPVASVPVYRAYNNGSTRGIESNHRITTSRTAIEQVAARGWVDEGIAMCAPQ